MAKRKASKPKQPADPFYVEGIDDIEGSNGWPTEQEILDGWRERLSKTVEALKDEPPKSVKGKQCIDARDALNQLDIMQVSFRPQVLLATVSLGILFERMGLRDIEPLILRGHAATKGQKKAVEAARDANTRWTPDYSRKAREILAELPASDTEDSKAQQIVTLMEKRHKILTSKSSVRTYLFTPKA